MTSFKSRIPSKVAGFTGLSIVSCPRGCGFPGRKREGDWRGSARIKWRRANDGSSIFGIKECDSKIAEFSKRTFSYKISYYFIYFIKLINKSILFLVYQFLEN
jgi:hypothetical protein